MIRLFTTVYPELNSVRREEYAECLRQNFKCAAIDEICLLIEGEVEIPDSPKIRTRGVTSRPLYENFFTWMSEIADPDDILILANTDIWFGDQIGVLRNGDLPRGEVWALSRWDIRGDGAAELYLRKDSQDVWIFRGAPAGVASSFPLGVPRCDNRIAAELARAGYRVRNPSFSLCAFHLHSAPPRPYLEEEYSETIPPPYLYVWPENYWCWPRIVLHNLRNPEAKLCYRFDSRRWSPMRLFHGARFRLGAFRRKLMGVGC
jgi:hypothetical protein